MVATRQRSGDEATLWQAWRGDTSGPVPVPTSVIWTPMPSKKRMVEKRERGGWGVEVGRETPGISADDKTNASRMDSVAWQAV